MTRTLPAARFLLGAAAALTLSAPAWAQPSPALDRASVSAGAFWADPTIKATANTQYGNIDSGDYEPDRVTLPRVRADLLIGDSQGLAFDYYRYDKDYNPRLSGGANYLGQPLTGNGRLDAKLKLDLANFAYKWWLGQGNDVFGIGVGAAYYKGAIRGTASGTLNNIAGNARYDDSESAWAPLLELGWRHAFTPEVRMYAEASGIKKNGGNITGHIYSGMVGVEWFFAKNVGLVADYSVSKISLERDGRTDGDVNIRLKGPAAYVKLRF
ncbi:hypothetical protein ACLB1G_20940 [Oxalobacteraceae bacterium A2-2]